MKIETFFEKFNQLAEAPNAVAKMRELVMQLAVQGGLVPHSDKEPPVPCKSVEGAMPINLEEVPSNWRVVLLADAINTRSGNSKLIKGKLHEAPAPHLFQGFSASGADVWCDDYEHEGRAIIVSAVGARCGKAFKASGKWSAIANTHIARPDPTLFDFDFAYLVLNNEVFWVRGGSAQPFVKFPPSLERYYALPPLAEQKRIVAKVDELMALCDRLEAQQQERHTQHTALARASVARFAEAPIPANLDFLFHNSYTITPDDLSKTILTLAVQGMLVPQNPSDEPASALLAKIEERREQLIAAKHFRRSQLPVSEVADSFSIPESWEWMHLGNAMLNVTDGFHSTPKPTDTGVPYVTAKHVKPNLIDFENCLYVSPEDFKEISSKTRPTRGDVLVVNIGAGCGWPAVIEVDFEFAFKNVAILNRPDEVDPKYLFNYLLFRRDDIFEERTKGGAQPFLSLGMIREIPFPLPPLAEQQRIVAKVDQLMALVDQLETQLTASRVITANLLEALVAELTAQEIIQ